MHKNQTKPKPKTKKGSMDGKTWKALKRRRNDLSLNKTVKLKRGPSTKQKIIRMSLNFIDF